MTKYLLLIGLAWVLWWIWCKSRAARSGSERSRTVQREEERMVACAHCGVNQPVSESILANDRYYCCAAHLREAQSGDA
jgi:hypothetical protein